MSPSHALQRTAPTDAELEVVGRIRTPLAIKRNKSQPMRFRLTSLLTTALLAAACHAADTLEQIDLNQALREIVPEHKLVAGDQSWTGGIQTNQVNATQLSANSAFFILADSTSAAPAKLAERIRDGLKKRCDLPEAGSKSWMRPVPREVSADDFAEAYYQTSAPARYAFFSVRVIRLASQRLAVSISYASLQ